MSCTFEVYLYPLGPVNVIDGMVGSIAVIVAVMVTCFAVVPPGLAWPDGVVDCAAVSMSGSPGFLRRTTTFS